MNSYNRHMNHRAFGAIELISVLAILAILAALVAPRVLQTVRTTQSTQTVNEAHITQALVAIQGIQPAITAHLAQFGSLASRNGTPLAFPDTYDNFGQVLLTEGLIERPFELGIGTNATLRLIKVSGVTSGTTVTGFNGVYDLDGDGRNDVAGAAFVLEAVVPGVNELEARALNDRLDGSRLGAGPGQSDLLGRLVYLAPAPDGTTTLHIYLMRK